MGSPRRLLHVVTSAASIAVLVWWLCTVPASGSYAAVVMISALALSTATSTVVGVLVWRRPPPCVGPAGRSKDLTILVMATEDDTGEKLLTAVALAQSAGEVIVGDLSQNPRRDLAADLGVMLLSGADPAEIADTALATASGEAFCILSAQACAVASELRLATAAMRDEVGWIVAETRPYNEDRFAPLPHISTDDHIDGLATAWDLHAWHPNATILRTQAAREVGGFEMHRTWGSLLRRLAEAGYGACRVRNVVCVVAAPSEARRFWRNQAWRERARVAEGSDALRNRGGSAAGRFAGLAVALRGLHGIPGILWVVGFGTVAVTGHAFTTAPLLPFTVALCVTAVLRTLVVGPSLDPVRVNEEVERAVYKVPASLSAIPGLLGRTEPITSFGGATTVLPTRALLLGCLLLCLAIGQGGAALLWSLPVGDRALHVWGIAASGLVLAFLVEAVAYAGSLRRSGRDSYRFPLDVRVSVDGAAARSADISAGGLRCRVATQLEVDRVVALTVEFAGCAMRVSGIVRHVGEGADGSFDTGFQLVEPVSVRCRWVRALFAEAGILEGVPTRISAETRERTPVSASA